MLTKGSIHRCVLVKVGILPWETMRRGSDQIPTFLEPRLAFRGYISFFGILQHQLFHECNTYLTVGQHYFTCFTGRQDKPCSSWVKKWNPWVLFCSSPCHKLTRQVLQISRFRRKFPLVLLTRSSWLNCALQGDAYEVEKAILNKCASAVYWLIIWRKWLELVSTESL